MLAFGSELQLLTWKPGPVLSLSSIFKGGAQIWKLEKLANYYSPPSPSSTHFPIFWNPKFCLKQALMETNLSNTDIGQKAAFWNERHWKNYAFFLSVHIHNIFCFIIVVFYAFMLIIIIISYFIIEKNAICTIYDS